MYFFRNPAFRTNRGNVRDEARSVLKVLHVCQQAIFVNNVTVSQKSIVGESNCLSFKEAWQPRNTLLFPQLYTQIASSFENIETRKILILIYIFSKKTQYDSVIYRYKKRYSSYIKLYKKSTNECKNVSRLIDARDLLNL